MVFTLPLVGFAQTDYFYVLGPFVFHGFIVVTICVIVKQIIKNVETVESQHQTASGNGMKTNCYVKRDFIRTKCTAYKDFWNNLRSIIRYHLFYSWERLLDYVADPLINSP